MVKLHPIPHRWSVAETTLEYLCNQTQAAKAGDSADRAVGLGQDANDRAIATDIQMGLMAREIPRRHHINPKRLARVRAFLTSACSTVTL